MSSNHENDYLACRYRRLGGPDYKGLYCVFEGQEKMRKITLRDCVFCKKKEYK